MSTSRLPLTLPIGLANSAADKYEPFSSITQKSLLYALKEHGLSLSAVETEDMMRAYDSLSTFPDVKPALEALGKEGDFTSVFFSQGTYAMVHASVTKSPDLSPYSTSLFKDIVVVEEIEKFKASQAGKSFRGARMIWTVLRAHGNRQIAESMRECITIKKQYPNLICGFDCVGQEDRGRLKERHGST